MTQLHPASIWLRSDHGVLAIAMVGCWACPRTESKRISDVESAIEFADKLVAAGWAPSPESAYALCPRCAKAAKVEP